MIQDSKIQNKRLVRSLQLQIDEILRLLILRAAQVAHVGYPNHWNSGDAAIWLGTKASLDRLGVEITYQCDSVYYNRDVMAESIGDGLILIAGGGNLGDLWPGLQLFREKILQDFPENPVLQLPQSLWFGNQDNLIRFQRICNQHPNFHILLREHQSIRKAGEFFSVPVTLCPDMAFGLGSLDRPIRPMMDIMCLVKYPLIHHNTHLYTHSKV